MNESQVTIEEVNDAAEIVRRQEHRECSQRNWDWLRAHGADLLPQAFGMFLAVAGQEAFLAATLEEALNWANTSHPDDTGRIVEYVMPPQGPRCYADRR